MTRRAEREARRVVLGVSIALVACKDSAPKQAPPPPPEPRAADAATGPAWTAACADALAAKATPVRRLSAILDACRPCGDWAPLLAWATPHAEGGATDAQLGEMLVACDAFCSNDAKMQVTNALGDTRGKATNKPWRILGEKCGAQVSAVPDTRFMSAPYFALDRIARAAAADATLAPLLAKLELPLPPVSLTGVGYELPVANVMKPEPGRVHVTLSAAELRVGRLPIATLSAAGVTVDHGPAPYPGERVTAADLRAKLDALAGSPTGRVVVIAPTGLAASRVVEVVAAAGDHEVVLAVAAAGGPPGWTLPGIVPVVLDARPDAARVAWPLDAGVEQAIADLKGKPAAAFDHPRIAVAKDATVAHLAKLLGALAFRDARAASLTNARN